MDIEKLKQKLAELEAELAAVRDDKDLSVTDRSKEVLRVTGEIKAQKAEIQVAEEAEAALAEADAEAKAAEEAAAQAAAQAEADAAAKAAEEAAAQGEGKGDEGETAEDGAQAPALAASAPSEEDGEIGDKPAENPFTLTASSGIGGATAGDSLDREGVLAQMQYAQRSQSSAKIRLFEMNRFPKGTPVLTASNSAIENSRIMREARAANQKPLGLTAAACFCGPDEVRSDFDVIGRRGRPVRDIFNSGAIGTGGFTYYPDIAIDPDSGSVNLWDCTDQDGVDPGDPETWKQCSELDCFTPKDALAYMITACTIVQRTHQWAHPEQVDTWLDKIRLEYDRNAEKALLNIIDDAAGTPLTIGASGGMMATFGVRAQIEYALASLAFSLGYQFRADALEGHVAIIPRGFLDTLVADEHIRGFDRGAARAEIVRQTFEDYGVRLVERLDEADRDGLTTAASATVTALNAGGAIDASGTEPTKSPLRPAFSRMYVLRPDQWFHAEGTMVAADWHVDTALLRQNKMLWFMENIELLEQTGLEKPHIVDVYGPINGARADLVTPPS